MVRIDGDLDSEQVRAIAEQAGAKLVWRRARCEHGYTSDGSCIDCENGYVTDTHRFASVGQVATDPKTGSRLIGLTDDMEEVCYVPKRYESTLLRVRGGHF